MTPSTDGRQWRGHRPYRWVRLTQREMLAIAELEGDIASDDPELSGRFQLLWSLGATDLGQKPRVPTAEAPQPGSPVEAKRDHAGCRLLPVVRAMLAVVLFLAALLAIVTAGVEVTSSVAHMPLTTAASALPNRFTTEVTGTTSPKLQRSIAPATGRAAPG